MYPFVVLRNQFINGVTQLQNLLSSSWTSKITANKQLFFRIYPLFFHKFCIPIWFIIIWECLIHILQLPNYILPTPFEVLKSLIDHAALITSETLPTLVEILLGLFFGVILGVTIALSMSLFRPLHNFLLPLLLASQALPVFAIAPLLVLWFGYGVIAKIITTTFMLFFPITNNFLDGLKQTPKNYLNMAEMMNSSRWQILLQIRIPAALPNLASGIRLATTMAPLGAIVGEWVGSNQGLGFLLLNANAQMQIDLMFAVLLVIFFLGILLYYLVDTLIKLALPWTLLPSH
ncbi:ABC transporter permease [Rickettsiella endosymbiont of Aleochara curtula]|uniref:ABC transporter permease n=1 Tax=Rickettsiella endosymbiont of Aleochara curtula TaxID=3077936 RepID=UPI00313A9F27